MPIKSTDAVQGRIYRLRPAAAAGFVLAEVVVVVALFALFVGLAVLNTAGLVQKHSFKGQAQQLVSTMEKAATAAAETGRKYEVIFDIAEQSYLLREITTGDLAEVLDDEIIRTRYLGEECQIYYVQFDDLDSTDAENQIARFRAGPAGWNYGGKIVLLDANGDAHSVVVNRVNRMVTLEPGDIELPLPREAYEVAF